MIIWKWDPKMDLGVMVKNFEGCIKHPKQNNKSKIIMYYWFFNSLN